MPFSIIIAGVLLFLISLLWYIWAGRLVRGERASLRGTRVGPTDSLAAEAAPLPPPTRGSRGTPTSVRPSARQWISREFRVTYNRRIYVHKLFSLSVVFIPETQKLPELTAKERRVLQEAVRDRLEFRAQDAEPLVQVELKCREDAFEILDAAQAQRLGSGKETSFAFLLRPLKAEVCLITVVISYLQQEDVPETVKTVEIVETVEESAEGVSRTRVTRSIRIPAGQETVVLPVKTIPLTVEVKSFWRFSASGLSLLQKALGPLVVSLLLAMALLSGRKIDRMEAIWYAIVGLANAAGIPLIDAVAQPFAAEGEDVG